MASSISSLGIGSGVLTADVIDQLKEADEARIITPLEGKITINNQKQDAGELLTSLMKSFKASASALSYDTVFDNKNVEVDGKAGVTIEAGASVESFTLETVELAKKNIVSFGAFSDRNSTSVAPRDGVLKINDFKIPYDSTTTLADLAQSITDIAGDSVSASILQTGEHTYNLVVSSKLTGADNTLKIKDTNHVGQGQGALNSSLFDSYDRSKNSTGFQNIQEASDATFKYNGITVTRSTNTVDDLILGVSISLKEEGNISTVNITQDTNSITDELQLFADSYNTLMTNLRDMTAKDEENGAEGVFNGNSFVKSISRDLTKAITALNGNRDSLINYGIDIDRFGTMSFDTKILEEKLATDSDAVELFFTGGVDSEGNDVTGLFKSIDEKLNAYTGYGKLLSNFEVNLETEGTNLSESHQKLQASLNSRYEIMAQRFIAYDAIISRLNSQFSSLQMMIDADNE